MLLGQRGKMLADGFGKMQPHQPVPSLRRSGRAVERAAVGLAQKFENCPAFKHCAPVDLQRRNAACGGDVRKRRFMQIAPEGVGHHIDRQSKLIYEPQNAKRTALRNMMQDQFHRSGWTMPVRIRNST